MISTYLSGGLAAVDQLRCPDGVTSAGQLRAALDDDVASVVVQYPNFAGTVEDLEELAGECHRTGAALIVIADPIALGLLQSPGALGADIVVGEGQSMGTSPLRGTLPRIHVCSRQISQVSSGKDLRCDDGRGRQQRVCADASGQRAAYSERACVLQHLHESGAKRTGGNDLPESDG